MNLKSFGLDYRAIGLSRISGVLLTISTPYHPATNVGYLPAKPVL